MSGLPSLGSGPKAANGAERYRTLTFSGQTGVSSSELFFLSGNVSYFHGTSKFANSGFVLISRFILASKI